MTYLNSPANTMTRLQVLNFRLNKETESMSNSVQELAQINTIRLENTSTNTLENNSIGERSMKGSSVHIILFFS